jgi:hypothetical protein
MTALSQAQPVFTAADTVVSNSVFQLASDLDLSSLPISDLLSEIGKSFIGTPYAAGTLDKNDEEKLTVSLTGLDCYTFLESSLVLARVVQSGVHSFSGFLAELENIRYRGGRIAGYISRLHYFSDWIFDMDKRGIGKDITRSIGGRPYIKNIDFMSTHTYAYRQLKDNPALVEKIIFIENEISSRSYFFVPQQEIQNAEKEINSGDIIGITTNVEGLDISHTGIALREDDGRIHLLHAPNVGYKIQITEKPLADYIKGNKKQTGIMVLRPSEIN